MLNDKNIPNANRISKQFNREKKSQASRIDIDSIKDTIHGNAFINIKDIKDNSDEMDYILKKMNKMGKKSRVFLHELYPSLKADRIAKTKPKTKFRKIVLPAAIGALLFAPSLLGLGSSPLGSIVGSSVKSVFTKNTKTSEDPDNIFGLKAKDKADLKKMKEKMGDEEATLDKLVAFVSKGAILSIPGLIFGFTTFKQSGIYSLFKEQLEKFQKGAVELFSKILKNTFNWIKDNIFNSPFNLGFNLGSKLREKVINFINRLFKTEIVGSSIKKSDPVDAVGITLAGSLREMVLSYIGIDGSDKSSLSGEVTKRKSFIDKIKDNVKEALNIETDDTGEIFADQGNFNVDLSKVPSNLKSQSGIQLAVYSGLRRAGFSDNQSRILNAEIGREGSFALKNIFGYHNDPHKGVNLGMISWQGSRGRNLEAWMKKAGMLKNGRMEVSQAAIDMQAKFIMHEITTDKRYARTKKIFLNNPNVSYNVAKEVLGTNYIRWRYTDRKYAQGHKNRDTFYRRINKSLEGASKETGDMNWNNAPVAPKPSSEKKNKSAHISSYNKPNFEYPKSDNFINITRQEKEISEVGDIPLEINTIEPTNTKTARRSRITSSFTNSFNNTRKSTEQNIKQYKSSNISHTKSMHSNNQDNVAHKQYSETSADTNKLPMKSLYELLLERDLTGDMF